MGKHDLVEQVLAEFSAEFFFTGALIQPGRPIVFGRAKSPAGETFFFGLPGNPVSTMVTFDLFARPILDALAGAQPSPLYFVQVKLKADIKTKTGLTRFLPGRLSGAHDQTQVELVRWQGSGDVVATAAANCYVVIPPDRDRITAGELVSVLLP
jgi:molybdopterin molybdotransferase